MSNQAQHSAVLRVYPLKRNENTPRKGFLDGEPEVGSRPQSQNYYSGGPQKVWRDRENSKLEAQIPKCVAGMMRIALKERADDRAREERERAHQKRVDEVAAELEKIRAEEKRIKLLRRDAGAWHRAERIRKYVAAVRESGAKDTEWLTWAELQADRLDPLKEKPKSIVDDKEEVLKRLRKVEWGW